MCKFLAGGALLVCSLISTLSGGVIAKTPVPATGGFAHPEWIADAAWLQEHLDDPALAIVALTSIEEFELGHIPGAVQIDWPDLEIVETSDQSVGSWRADIESTLTGLDVERGDTVVVYDGGTLYSARLWWILYQLGHADVRILNGGLGAWSEAGGQLETGPSIARPAAEPYAGEPNEAAIAQIGEVEDALSSGDAVFVDARSSDEYAAGHIPGAVNVPFTENAVSGDPKFWKSVDELRELYGILGSTADNRIIPYCSTGVRSAMTYFTLRQLGYEDVALFSGSFVEWTADPNRPVTIGDQP